MVLNFMLIPIKEGACTGVGSLVSKMQAFVYKISGFHKRVDHEGIQLLRDIEPPEAASLFPGEKWHSVRAGERKVQKGSKGV